MSNTLKVFLVDYGALMTEDNKDFKAYSDVYDHKYGYFSYGQFYAEKWKKRINM